MKKIFILMLLNTTLIIHSMDSDSLSSSSGEDDTLSSIIFTDNQTISRAQSFVLSKPFQAIGDEFVMYPHYLNDENEEYYIEQRDIAMS